MDFGLKMQASQLYERHLGFLAMIWVLGVFPLFYTVNGLWSRFGDARFVAVSTALCLLLMIRARKLLISATVIPAFLYLALSLYYVGKELPHVGSMVHFELLSILVLTLSGLITKEVGVSSIERGVLWMALIGLSLAIFFNSLDIKEGIIGLNHRKDLTSFNYLLPAYSLISMFVLFQSMGSWKSCKIGEYVLILVVFLGAYCSGSRVALYVFSFIICMRLLFMLKVNLMHRPHLFFGLIGFIAVAFVLINYSTHAFLKRYNPMWLLADPSFVARVNYFQDSFVDDSKRSEPQASIDVPMKPKSQTLHTAAGSTNRLVIPEVEPKSEKASEDYVFFKKIESQLVGMADLSKEIFVKSSRMIFGLKLFDKESVKKLGYSHTFYEVFKSYGLLFAVVFAYLAARSVRDLSKQINALPMVFFLCITLWTMGDVYCLWWFSIIATYINVDDLSISKSVVRNL